MESVGELHKETRRLLKGDF